MKNTKNAALIIIGNEILSGRTLDINTQFIAKNLAEIGINLTEVRTIKDDKNIIVENVRYFKNIVNYIFTTGGIGPTHDDLTAEAISLALNKKYVKNEIFYQMLSERWQNEMNHGRIKMSYTPEEAIVRDGLIGFRIENIFVMPGNPQEMQRFFNNFKDDLGISAEIISKSINFYKGESFFCLELAEIQNKYQEIEIGSYPFERENGKFGASIILRSNNENLLKFCYEEVEILSKKYNKGEEQ